MFLGGQLRDIDQCESFSAGGQYHLRKIPEWSDHLHYKIDWAKNNHECPMIDKRATVSQHVYSHNN